jgi:hypothetical protein
MEMDVIACRFGLRAAPERLPGGSRPTYRAGDAVLKQIGATSLEHHRSRELARWIAGFSGELDGDGYRFPRALPTRDGHWITEDGWTAWAFVAGRHSSAADVPACVAGIRALHEALARIPRHPLLDENRTAWGVADVWCWGEPPAEVHPALREHVAALYTLRRPLPEPPRQLIHADLNPENILVAPDLPPAFIDLSPFWRPADFALAIYANWIGPRRGDLAVLRHFDGVPAFDQLLVRASIRMLLVMSALGRLGDWETCSEKRAAELVMEYVR